MRALLARTRFSEVAISCDPGAVPGLRKIGKQGRFPRKRNRPLALVNRNYFSRSLFSYSWVASRLRRALGMSGAGIGTLAGIKRSTMALGLGGLLFGTADIAGQSTGPSSSSISSSQSARDATTQAVPPSPTTGADILSDTRGVDLETPYMKQLQIASRNPGLH